MVHDARRRNLDDSDREFRRDGGNTGVIPENVMFSRRQYTGYPQQQREPGTFQPSEQLLRVMGEHLVKAGERGSLCGAIGSEAKQSPTGCKRRLSRLRRDRFTPRNDRVDGTARE
jgi:hypothetical protein